MRIISYGLDYVRYKVLDQAGVTAICNVLPYVDIVGRWYHGELCVDLSGESLALIRMFDDLDEIVLQLAETFQITRLDVFVDVAGNVIDDVDHPGTVIMNDGAIETVYSANLASRGNMPVFARCYDALKAEHYGLPATRFECEFKQQLSRGIIDHTGWNIDPVSVALWHIKDIFGAELEIPGKPAVEFYPPKRRLCASRERFYRRYGKNIMLDIEHYGAQGLYTFIQECIGATNEKESCTESEGAQVAEFVTWHNKFVGDNERDSVGSVGFLVRSDGSTYVRTLR